MQNREELSQILRATFSKKTKEEWLQLFKDTDVPISPALTLEEALINPQIIHRELVKRLIDPELGKEIQVPGFPVKFSEISLELPSPPPRVGQHTREILEQLGYLEEVISSL